MSAAEQMERSPERHFETTCGRVTLIKPMAPDVYWRLFWYEDDTRKSTTGGRTASSALKKATDIIARLDAGAAPKSRRRVGEVLEAYVTLVGQNLSPNHHYQVNLDLPKALGGLLNLRCENLSKAELRAGCQSASTESSFIHRVSRVRTFLKWGYGEDYFTEAQTHALDNLKWVKPEGFVARPKREFSPPPTSETERYITPDQVPSHAKVAALAKGLDTVLPYGELMIELAAGAGLRSGELYALDAPAVALADREIAVNWQALSLSGLPTRKARPKYGRVRTTNFADVTLNGFALYDALGERLEQVEFEHRQGRNPKRLLFPAPKGGWWWASSFTAKCFSKAADLAGWDKHEWTEVNDEGTVVNRRLWVHTMHSLRHRFARDRIDIYNHTISELQELSPR